MIVMDATNQVLGRLASLAAKQLLRGETVRIVNAEQAAIIGNPKATLLDFKAKRARGDPYHGPFYPKQADLILRRVIRGMLPYKTPRGREAFKRLRVFINMPEDLRGHELAKMDGAGNKGERKSITLKHLVNRL